MKPIIWGYTISVLLGVPVTWLVSRTLHKIAKRRFPKEEEASTEVRILWVAILIGIVERTLITTMVAWNISGTAGFIGAWVVVKSAVGWQAWADKRSFYERVVMFVGLIGSGVSVLFALIGGILISGSCK